MTSLHKLSLPTSINTTDDSFSRDLIRQFDKRRSRLHFELGFTSQAPSEESSIINTSSIHHHNHNHPVDYSNLEPIPLDHDIDDEEDDLSERQKRTSYSSKRSSSASDLFRRSSAYLMSKLNLIKKKDDPLHTANRQTKLLMKTTITVPSTTTTTTTPNTNNTNNTSHLDQVLANPIPVITQYPPKPLVYSPVEPIPDTDKQKPLLHRISMPLLRVYQDSHSLTRNKSIASFVTRRRKSEPHHTKKK